MKNFHVIEKCVSWHLDCIYQSTVGSCLFYKPRPIIWFTGSNAAQQKNDEILKSNLPGLLFVIYFSFGLSCWVSIYSKAALPLHPARLMLLPLYYSGTSCIHLISRHAFLTEWWGFCCMQCIALYSNDALSLYKCSRRQKKCNLIPKTRERCILDKEDTPVSSTSKYYLVYVQVTYEVSCYWDTELIYVCF